MSDSFDNQSIIELLYDLSVQISENSTGSRHKAHLNFIRFIYQHRTKLAPDLFEIISQQPFHDLWWLHLPPMEMAKSSLLHWIALMKHKNEEPERKMFYDSFIYQYQWLQKKKINFDERHFQPSSQHSQKWEPMIQSRLYILRIMNYIQSGQVDEMQAYLKQERIDWQKGIKRFCPLIQWQLIEFLAINNEWHWAKTILNIPINTAHHFEEVYFSLIDFWRKVILNIERQRTLEMQFEWNTLEKRFFAAPKYYELIFTSVLLKGKYLRDFHLEKFNKRKMELIQETGYLLFKHWPNVSEFK